MDLAGSILDASPTDFRDLWVEEVGKVDGDFSNKTWVS